MRMISGFKRLTKLSLYLALGGLSALSSACGGTTRPRQDADTTAPDTGTPDADASDADVDTPQSSDADSEMWDVIYE